MTSYNPVTHFVGREEERAFLRDYLRPGRIVTLCGPGGMGKTALMRWAINDPTIKERFPDGVLIHPFYEEKEAEQALGRIARHFGLDPRPDAQAAAVQALADCRLLLVLDGAEAADDLRAVVQVRGAGCGLLITSQNRAHTWDKRLDIGTLPPDKSQDLLERWAGGGHMDEAAAMAIRKFVGDLPLALRLVGSYLDATGMSAAEYVQATEAEQLRVLEAPDFPERSLMVVLGRSRNRLNKAAREAWALLGVLALAPFAGAEVVAALGDRAGAALQQLVQFGLLGREEDGRYVVSHALVYRYAHQFLKVTVGTVGRLAGYYDQLARRESERGLAGYHELDKVRPHLLACLEACAGAEAWRECVRLVWAVEDYLDIRGYWLEWRVALTLGITAAQRLGERYDEGAFLTHLGLAHAAMGHIAQAIPFYEQARTIWQALQDKKSEGVVLGNLGNAYRNLGEVETAVTYHQQALAISREIGDKRAEGQDLGNLGLAYAALGEVETAVSHYQQALAIAREIGDKQIEGNALGNLGNAYAALGEVETAKSHYEQALAIAEAIGDRSGAGNHAWNLGLLLEEDDPVQAIVLMSRLVAYEEAIGHPDAAAATEYVAAIRRRLAP